MIQKYIKIKDIKTSNNKLKAKLDFSKNISKYFLAEQFFAEYDKNIECIDASVLIIPPLSVIIPLSWATGADIYVEKLDKSFLDSIHKIEYTFHSWFPQFSFTGNIHVESVVENAIYNRSDDKGYALLFSGGLDSLTSYMRYKDKYPTLISIHGADIPTYEYKFWNVVKDRLLNFAYKENAKIQFIKTNAKEILDDVRLQDDYNVKSWWGSVSHGLILLGSCSPITNTDDIGTLIIASSPSASVCTPDYVLERWGSHPFTDNYIKWSNIKIVHDGFDINKNCYELTRQEKIKFLKNSTNCMSYLRVCWSQHDEYNCGYCEKCLRTIVGLILEDIDPEICNFNIKNNILELVRIYIYKRLFTLRGSEWQDIQTHIPNTMSETETNKKYNSEKFFEWFKKFDFSNYKYNNSILTNFLKFYYLIKYIGIYKGIKVTYHWQRM